MTRFGSASLCHPGDLVGGAGTDEDDGEVGRRVLLAVVVAVLALVSACSGRGPGTGRW